MAGDATYAENETVAGRARVMLDGIADAVSRMEAVQRDVVSQLLELWSVSGWKAAGARSAKAWLHTATGLSYREAARLEHIAELCARNDQFAAAVVEGRVPLGWADVLSRVVTDERAPYFTDDIANAFIELADTGASDDQVREAAEFWKSRADEHTRPRRQQSHSLVASQRLFGGGEIHATLLPSAFETVMVAIDAFCQPPDAADAPIQRTLSERRADALDDLAHYALTTHPDTDDITWDDDRDTTWSSGNNSDDESWDVNDDAFDATPVASDELLDELLHVDPADEPRDELDAWRRALSRKLDHPQRRSHRQLKPRSGARVNVHIDLKTLAGQRDPDDFDGLTVRGDMWNISRHAAELLLCDSTLVATIFSGNRILDANTDAERFSQRQRRAIAARDRHCIFPGCRRGPRYCDTHHLHERNDGGPTIVDNGCLLCRHHHRLLHIHGWKLHYNDQLGLWVATDPHHHECTERRPDQPSAA